MKYNKLLFLFILLILTFPSLQKSFQLINIKPLKGSYILNKKPDSLNFRTWFSGIFQKKYSSYYNDFLGFRPFLVRINNQIEYSLFNKVHTKLTVLGKNNHLFQSDYIDSYYGLDYVGENRVQDGINKLKLIQKKLNENNIQFILILAPGKASFMPENIPQFYAKHTKHKTNYDEYINQLKNSNINYIDFRQYFQMIKDTCRYPLFPLNGAHWSGYGCTIVSDSMNTYISKLMGINMPKQVSNGGYITNIDLKGSDEDLAIPLNIFEKVKNNNMYYPNIQYITNKNTSRPNALFIGDSYIYSFFQFYPYYENCFGQNTSCWGYNYLVKWDHGRKINKDIFVRNLNVEKEILSRDIIIILITQSNIKLIDNLFTDRLYNTLKDTINDSQIDKIIERIKSNKDWYDKVKQQAIEENILLDNMLRRNARYTIKGTSNNRNKKESTLKN